MCLIILLGFFSCSTNTTTLNDPVIQFFSGNIEQDWERGLDWLKENPKKSYLSILYTLYFDDKFSILNDKLKDLIYEYITLYDENFSDIVSFVKNKKQVSSAVELVRNFSDKELLSFSESIYKQESSDIKSLFIEDLGRNALDYSKVVHIFESENYNVKTGVILSAGYLINSEIQDWLVKRLYDADEGISSGALFSLSKHGDRGFSLISNNMIYLSNRLILISIDLLTFNKFSEVYSYFPELLNKENDLLTDRILKSYESLTKSEIFYILEALKTCPPSLRLPLLKILEKFEGDEYYNKILFLFNYIDLQSYLIDLFYRNNASFLLRQILVGDDYGINNLIIDYGVENNSKLILMDSIIENISISYFLNNYDLDTVKNYFKNTNVEKKYISDYEYVFKINSSIKVISSIEELQNDFDFISKYFKIEQKINIANNESDAFFQSMENWLETGSDSFLDESLSIKKGSNINTSGLDEKNNFLKTLNSSDLAVIESYERAKRDLVLTYRKLTYRLKGFANNLINNSGYSRFLE